MPKLLVLLLVLTMGFNTTTFAQCCPTDVQIYPTCNPNMVLNDAGCPSPNILYFDPTAAAALLIGHPNRKVGLPFKICFTRPTGCSGSMFPLQILAHRTTTQPDNNTDWSETPDQFLVFDDVNDYNAAVTTFTGTNVHPLLTNPVSQGQNVCIEICLPMNVSLLDPEVYYTFDLNFGTDNNPPCEKHYSTNKPDCSFHIINPNVIPGGGVNNDPPYLCDMCVID
ncbi:MAG: hypothetical protein NTX03_15360 [Bacteroidetes bacterium]|nr:hypothetical protein [Bacteroidota bacterium]